MFWAAVNEEILKTFERMQGNFSFYKYIILFD